MERARRSRPSARLHQPRARRTSSTGTRSPRRGREQLADVLPHRELIAGRLDRAVLGEALERSPAPPRARSRRRASRSEFVRRERERLLPARRRAADDQRRAFEQLLEVPVAERRAVERAVRLLRELREPLVHDPEAPSCAAAASGGSRRSRARRSSRADLRGDERAALLLLVEGAERLRRRSSACPGRGASAAAPSARRGSPNASFTSASTSASPQVARPPRRSCARAGTTSCRRPCTAAELNLSRTALMPIGQRLGGSVPSISCFSSCA